RSAASSALAPSWTTQPRSRMAARSVTASTFCAFCSTRMADMPSSRMTRLSAARSSSTRIGASPSSGSAGRNKPRMGNKGAAAREHRLLAAGELIAEIAPPLGEPRKQLVDARDRPPPRSLDGSEILLDRERLEDVALLRHPADAGMRPLVRAQWRELAARK